MPTGRFSPGGHAVPLAVIESLGADSISPHSSSSSSLSLFFEGVENYDSKD